MKKLFVMAVAVLFSAASMAQTTQKKPMKKNKMSMDSTHSMHNGMGTDSLSMNKNHSGKWDSKKSKMKSKSKMSVDSSGSMQ